MVQVLGDMPQKTFAFTRRKEANVPLQLPDQATPDQALKRVLRLPGVGSKRFLTTKVDRCVTGEFALCHQAPQRLCQLLSERKVLNCMLAADCRRDQQACMRA